MNSFYNPIEIVDTLAGGSRQRAGPRHNMLCAASNLERADFRLPGYEQRTIFMKFSHAKNLSSEQTVST